MSLTSQIFAEVASNIERGETAIKGDLESVYFDYRSKDLLTFWVYINHGINKPKFTISSDKNADVQGMTMSENKLIEYLPVGVYDVYPNIINYDASNCSIKELSNDVFSKLSQLDALNLDNNEIRVIYRGVFDDLISLTALYLRSNRIVYIDAETFKNSKSLEILMLDKNRQQKIDFLDHFPRTTLREFSLSGNLLTFLRENLFKSNTNLESIWLDNNKISSIPSKLFDNLPKLKAVDLANNVCISWNEGDISRLKQEIKMRCSPKKLN